MINAGVIGLGGWGKNILRNLYELGAVRIACDINAQTIKEREKEFPDIKYTLYFEDILKDPKIDAVVIATPPATHYNLGKKALEAGKDIFVEKPLTLTLRHAQELGNIAKEKNKILMTGHILHYHPAVIKLKELIDNMELGKVQYIYSNRLNIGKLKVEENILWSFAPHDISVILMLVGDEPEKINCFGEYYLSEQIYDITMTNLEFKNRIKAHIFVSWLHPYKEQKLIVVGSKAMAVFDDLTKEKLFIYPHEIEWTNGKIPIARKADHYCVKISDEEPLKVELKHFLECVKNRQTPKTDADEAIKVLRVLERSEKSIRCKRSDDLIVNTIPESTVTVNYFTHPTCFVDENTDIGDGTKIWHYSHILKGTKIGKNCVIGQNVMIGPDVSVGSMCKIQNNVSVYKGVTIQDEVFCGPSCVFTNVYTPRAFIERKNAFLPTLVKRGATIGANATIICGVTIGRYAMVGAGAVVKKDVPDYALVVGVPARQIGWVCECGVTLKQKGGLDIMQCKGCSNTYVVENNKLIQTGQRPDKSDISIEALIEDKQ
ncbi:MAG: Gfo/Idh/MocA family oxidoreductase [Candidatus Omnitrophota bacterium]